MLIGQFVIILEIYNTSQFKFVKRIYLIDLNNLRYSVSMGCALSSALKYNGVNKKGYQTKIADVL